MLFSLSDSGKSSNATRYDITDCQEGPLQSSKEARKRTIRQDSLEYSQSDIESDAPFDMPYSESEARKRPLIHDDDESLVKVSRADFDAATFR